MLQAAPTIAEANVLPYVHVIAAQGRGRSRQVSHVALARQASEERRMVTQSPFLQYSSTTESSTLPQSSAFLTEELAVPQSAHIPSQALALSPRSSSLHPTSSSSLALASGSGPPPTYYPAHTQPWESLPPAQTLEDQVHEAYAMEDIHRAKVLLLKLKGVEVTSDDDPRIAAVRDEDFDFLFLPFGALEDPDAERRAAMLEESARRLKEEQERRARWKARERIWESAKKSHREAVRKQKQMEKRRESRRQRDQPSSRPQIFSSYTRHTAHMTSTPCTDLISSSSSSHPPPSPSFDDSRSIPFHHLLLSMHGPLFPPTSEAPHEGSPRQTELLTSLLGCPEWEETDLTTAQDAGSPSVPINPDLQPPVITIIPSSTSTPPSAAFPVPPSHSTSSSSSRESSWFSLRSISTNLTTPSSSLSLRKWLKPSPPSAPPSSKRRRRYSRHPRCHRVACLLSDHPLVADNGYRSSATSKQSVSRPRSRSTASIVVKRVSQIVTLAKNFQQAYMKAALFSVSASIDSYEYLDGPTYVGVGVCRSGVGGGVYMLPPTRVQRTRPSKLRPAGYRVRSADVATFLSAPTHDWRIDDSDGDPSSDIPLRLRGRSRPAVPRTSLPNPLPYSTYFKPHPPITRSPVRLIRQQAEFQAASADGTADCPDALAWTCSCDGRSESLPGISPIYAPEPTITWRVRAVSNPVHLRLRALQNIIWSNGVQWEGRGGAEWALGSGKEKVVGVAYDGIGRSMLGRSFSAAVGR